MLWGLRRSPSFYPPTGPMLGKGRSEAESGWDPQTPIPGIRCHTKRYELFQATRNTQTIFNHPLCAHPE